MNGVRLAGCSVLAVAALTAGCSSTAGTTVTSPASTSTGSRTATGAATAGHWPTYDGSAARTGVSTSTPTVHRLRRAWTARLDGAVYAQPLVAAGHVVVATENDTIYALDPSSGRVRWRAHVGTPVPRAALPCGNIDPLGITGTPVYDPTTRRVFALAEVSGPRHLLVGVDVATGRVAVRRDLEPPRGDPKVHQQRAALALAAGRVYVAYGGLAGDCGNYVGAITSVRTDGTAPLSWAVPTRVRGGIWAPGGVVVGPGPRLYVSIGNGGAFSSYDGSDSVTALSPTLRRLDYFAPTTWAQDNRTDADLGSMSPALVAGKVFVAGKAGVGYLADATHLGGVGGQLAAHDVCRGFGAAAVDGSTVYVPCTDGVRQVRVSGDDFTVGWHGPTATNGPPVVGGGAVFSVDRDTGVLYALAAATGAVRARIDVGSVAHFASPALAGGRAYVPTTTGVTAVAVG